MMDKQIIRCSRWAIGFGLALSAGSSLIVSAVHGRPFSLSIANLTSAILAFAVGSSMGTIGYRLKDPSLDETMAKAIGRIVGWSVVAFYAGVVSVAIFVKWMIS